jgi:multiple sugar transport system permease protein
MALSTKVVGAPRSKRQVRFLLAETLKYFFLLVLVAVIVFPIFWIVSQSLTPESQILKWPIKLIPDSLTLEHYRDLFIAREGRPELPIVRWVINSIVVTSVTTLGILFISSLAAYAFARLEFPGRDKLFLIMGASMLIPGVLLLIPTFMIVRNLGWIDSYHALIWPKFAGFFGVFLLRQFFMSIPRELEEAAVIDGCSPFGIYWRIILPLAKPALATLAIFTFLAVWNEFEWPLIVLNSNEMRTLPIGLAIFNGEYWSEQGIIMAGAVFSSLPIVIVYLIFQRQITQAVATAGFGGR